MDEDVQAVRRIGGAVDDVVITGDTFHLERMDDDAWWAGIYRGDRCVSLWIACEAGRINVEVSNDEIGCVDDTPGPAAPSGPTDQQRGGAGAAARDVRATRLPDDQPARRWRKTPAAVEAELLQLLEQFRQQHAADPADVIEEVFITIGDLLTGFCLPGVSWTEPVAEQPPDTTAAERTP